MRHPHTGNKGKFDVPGWKIAVASGLWLVDEQTNPFNFCHPGSGRNLFVRPREAS
jgi:hypothetical protein